MAFARLLLIIPPQLLLMEGFRTALVALAAYVHRKLPELEIKLLDLSAVSPPAVQSRLKEELGRGSGRTVVGISTVTADYQAALGVAETLKVLDPEIIIIFGGHHASGDAKMVLETNSCVDYVICYEGEIPLHQFIASFPMVDSVPGLVFRAGHRIVKNAPAKPIEQDDLNLVPLTYEGWELATSPGKFDHVTYVSARGCPLKCAFCSVANQKIRAKSIAQVTRDIRMLVEKGFSKIAFEDNFFAHDKKRTREICEALAGLRAEGLTFSWDCQTRVESMDRAESIDLLQQAGCEAVYLGVESLNENALRFLGKTSNPKRYLSRLEEHVVPALMNSRIECYINLQYGLPGHIATADAIEERLQTMERLGKHLLLRNP